jgi:hypothetical protein
LCNASGARSGTNAASMAKLAENRSEAPRPDHAFIIRGQVSWLTDHGFVPPSQSAFFQGFPVVYLALG